MPGARRRQDPWAGGSAVEQGGHDAGRPPARLLRSEARDDGGAGAPRLPGWMGASAGGPCLAARARRAAPDGGGGAPAGHRADAGRPRPPAGHEEGGHAGPAARESALRRFLRVAAGGSRLGVRVAGADLRAVRAAGLESLARGDGRLRRRLPARRRRRQHVSLSSDAGGPPLRPRAGPARLHRGPDRSRERRGAGQDHPRSRRHGLRRHPVLPAGDPQACRREGARTASPRGRPGRGRGPAALAPAGHRDRPRDPDAPGLRHGGSRDHRLRVPGGRRDARHGGRRPRDLRSRDRRAAARGRDRRDRLHRQPSRLSHDPLRHRRPLGRHRGAVPVRAHRAAHARLARPCGRGDEGPGHVRPPAPGGRDRRPVPGGGPLAGGRDRETATRTGSSSTSSWRRGPARSR